MAEEDFHQVVAEAKELIKLLESSSVRRVRLAAGSFQIAIERGVNGTAAVAAAGAAPVLPSAAAPADKLHRVLAPMVGTFYHSSAPGTKPFIEVGQSVQRGQTIGIIEAMKVMNEVTSDSSGVIVEILVPNGQPVQFEQPLIVLDPQK